MDRLSSTARGTAAAPSPASLWLAGALAQAGEDARRALGVQDPTEAVHEVRKALKQARALLALPRGPQRPAARTLRREIREAAQTLARWRDGHVVHEALADVAAHSGLDARLCGDIAAALGTAPPDGTSLQTQMAGIAALAGGALAHAPLLAAQTHPDALLRALVDGYRRARRAGRKLNPDDAEALHDLRKEVVAHRWQMELVTPWWPRVGAAWTGELQRLRDQLGRHHDLEILLARLGDMTLDTGREGVTPQYPAPEDIARAMDAAHARQRRHAAKALRLHARLFAEPPKAFRRRLRVYMEASLDRP